MASKSGGRANRNACRPQPDGLSAATRYDHPLRPGRNCWRIERAPRLVVIVDAARYVAAAKAAIPQARRSLMLIGREFDLRSSRTATRSTSPTNSAGSSNGSCRRAPLTTSARAGKVVEADMEADNGVIRASDAVLVPEDPRSDLRDLKHKG